jgi:hypothetical protein
MAKLKATPKNFAEALIVLNGKSAVRLGNNTYLEQIISSQGQLAITVRLHNTNIVIFHHDGRVTLHTGGYRTVTTKGRINQFIAGKVGQKKFDWFYYPPKFGNDAQGWSTVDWDNPVEFEEGIEASR